MIKALIFDFDGLILDTESTDYQSWQDTYARYGVELPLEVWVGSIGKGTADITFDPYAHLEELLGQALDRETVWQQRQTRDAELVAALPILPGVMDTLNGAKARGMKLGVASSSDCAWVTGHLSRIGLIDYFDTIQCADMVNKTKPDPELYLAALKALDVDARRAIAFEDSANGSLAAKRAGMICVAVPNAMTRTLDFSHVDLQLNSLAELPLDALLRRFTARE